MDRRLAAILAADVVGFSALVGADEEGTLRALKGHLSALEPVIGINGGRVVKSTGDGFLAEFPSVVNAVACAETMQRQMAERNAAVRGAAEPGAARRSSARRCAAAHGRRAAVARRGGELGRFQLQKTQEARGPRDLGSGPCGRRFGNRECLDSQS